MDQEWGLVFVYGTLKRGQANHPQLGGAPFAGVATMPGLDLHDLGPFPMAIDGEGRVQGEVYRVDAGTLSRLDRFEGAPRLYRREARVLADGRRAWIYLGRARQVRHSPRLPHGIWPVTTPQPPLSVRSGASASARFARLLLALASPALWPGPAGAEASLALCQRWQRSSGAERIRLGNSIGAAAYLTKVRRFAESPPENPQPLYAAPDLERACDGWR